MARKITRPAAAAMPPPPENELEVLHPERVVTLRGGRRLMVREYAHVEWLRLLAPAEPLVASIAAALEQGRDPTYEEALACLAGNIDALAPLIAQACDLDLDDYAALPPDDGELVLMAWWGANGRFFVGRALNRVAVRRQERQARAAVQAGSDTARSTPA
ncbi:MAG: hypothetical protein LCI02_04850 [Proteobacteria bacterium]|nr:hypothetical protein [Pseudomonadota bacterium]